MGKNSKQANNGFEDITDISDLIKYLDSTNQRLAHTNYVYHYTTLSSAIKIIQSKRLFLNAAKNMNDLREYNNGDPKRWDNIFFSSFMQEDEESIGMWSMYAQPWGEGVKISIPKEEFKKWIEETKTIHEISKVNWQPTGGNITVDENHGVKVHISAVAYSNSDSYKNTKSKKEKLQCGTLENINISNAARIPELTGYIKDMAWSYEKEVRIKAEFDNNRNFQLVAIDIPDYVIDKMTITASPRFKGDLRERLEKKISQTIRTDNSLFEGMLVIKDPCDECEYIK